MPISAPTDISNCTLWLDPADGTTFTLTGSLVDSWTDKSANGYVLTGSSTSRPARTGTIGVGARTAVVFDGTDDFLNRNSSPINNSSNGAFTVFAAVTPSGALNERSIVDGDDSPHMGQRVCQFLRFDSGQAQTITFDTGGSNTSMQGGSISAGNTYRLCSWCDGPNGELFVNGSSVGTLTQSSQAYNASNTLTIGAQEGGTRQYFPGTIGLVIAYSRALNSTERGDVDSYISAWLAGGGGAASAAPDTPIILGQTATLTRSASW